MDDYERPVLEKYEKITPTPTVRDKKEKEEKVCIRTSIMIINKCMFLK